MMKNGSLYMVSIVWRILHSQDMKINRSEVYKVLLSDASYPSVLSIVNTFNFFGVGSEVYLSDYESLQENTYPVIVHTLEDGGHFYLYEQQGNSIYLYDGEGRRVSKEEFLRLWDGVIVLVNSLTTKRYKHFLHFPWELGLATFFLLLSIVFGTLSLFTLTYLMLNLCGAFVSALLVLRHYHEYEDIPLCHIGKSFDCMAVQHRRPLRHFDDVCFALLPLFYFVGITLCTAFGQIHTRFVYVIEWIAVAVALAMVGLQALVIRKYCLLCLTISFLVSLKCIILYVLGFPSAAGFNRGCVAFSLASVLCYVFAVKLNADRVIVGKSLSLLRFKRNGRVFRMLLNEGRELMVKSSCMVYGEIDAPITVHTFLRPHCRHCKKVVACMKHLLDMHKRIRWLISMDGFLDAQQSVEANLEQLIVLQTYKHDKVRALSILVDGFSIADYSMRNITENTIAEFKEQLEEMKANGIDAFPIITIDGHVMPREYEVEDLLYLL